MLKPLTGHFVVLIKFKEAYKLYSNLKLRLVKSLILHGVNYFVYGIGSKV